MSLKHSFPAGRKIDLFICGAQKAGTTSVKNYLGEHPEVQTHVQKEFAYFYDDNEYNRGGAAAARKYFGVFDTSKKLVAKNAGLYVKETAVKRLHQHNPDCKLVFILRNPVDRAYSAFQMEKNHGNCEGEFDDLESVFKKHDEGDWRYEFFIRMGMYAQFLEVILKYFPREQISIIRYEDFAKDNVAVCRKFFALLGVNPGFSPDISIKHNVTHMMRSPGYSRFVVQLLRNTNPIKKFAQRLLPSQHNYRIGEMLRNINKSSRKPDRISQSMRKLLSGIYQPHNEQLSQLSGIDFSDWNRAHHSSSNGEH